MNKIACCAMVILVLGTRFVTAADQGASESWLDQKAGGLMEVYRHLHAHPELSFQERETARRVANELRAVGFDVTEGVGRTGVVGVLRNGQGPTVLVRTDLDALPVVEQTGLPFASTVRTQDDSGADVGVMHACGHDVHMTVFLGTASWLAEHKDDWHGTLVFVGQPAEERVSGAKAMLADGLYEKFPIPDLALALHVTGELEAGRVGWVAGPFLASSTAVDIRVRGQGGHGGVPDKAVDPVVLAALLVLDLQTIVSREIKPTDPAVVTVGSIHGGSKHNIIPDEVSLQLTLRAYSDAVRDQLVSGIRRRAEGLALAHGAPPAEVTVGESTPTTINDAALVQRVVSALRDALGESAVVQGEPRTEAEDFGLFNRNNVPICMFWLGAATPEKLAEARAKGESPPSLHTPRFAPDAEPTIRTGVRAMTAAVVRLLPPGQK